MDIGNKVKKYMLTQLDKPTAWIGVIILTLQFLHLQSFIFIFAVAMIVLPMDSFTETFKKWTGKLNDLDKDA